MEKRGSMRQIEVLLPQFVAKLRMCRKYLVDKLIYFLETNDVSLYLCISEKKIINKQFKTLKL